MGFVVLFDFSARGMDDFNWLTLELSDINSAYNGDSNGIGRVISWMEVHLHELANESDLVRLVRTAKNFQIINGRI